MAAKDSPVLNDARRVLATLSSSFPVSCEGRTGARQPYTSPVFIGLTGLQGSGKSTWASALVDILQVEYKLRALTISLDDLYLPHDELVKLRDSNPTDKLLRTRGQPGTNDEQLARDFFARLSSAEDGSTIRIPMFDKSKFNGEGDRAPLEDWPEITTPVDVVVFEGWCLGFQPLTTSQLAQTLAEAVAKNREILTSNSVSDANSKSNSHSLAPFNSQITSKKHLLKTLPTHALPHLILLNSNLAQYTTSFLNPARFHCLIHLDTDDLSNVYKWRLSQEHALRLKTGAGMSDEEVEEFVKGYMPSYELYLEGLRKGLFLGKEGMGARDGDAEGVVEGEKGKLQVRVCLDQERNVVDYRLVGRCGGN